MTVSVCVQRTVKDGSIRVLVDGYNHLHRAGQHMPHYKEHTSTAHLTSTSGVPNP